MDTFCETSEYETPIHSNFVEPASILTTLLESKECLIKWNKSNLVDLPLFGLCLQVPVEQDSDKEVAFIYISLETGQYVTSLFVSPRMESPPVNVLQNSFVNSLDDEKSWKLVFTKVKDEVMVDMFGDLTSGTYVAKYVSKNVFVGFINKHKWLFKIKNTKPSCFTFKEARIVDNQVIIPLRTENREVQPIVMVRDGNTMTCDGIVSALKNVLNNETSLAEQAFPTANGTFDESVVEYLNAQIETYTINWSGARASKSMYGHITVYVSNKSSLLPLRINASRDQLEFLLDLEHKWFFNTFCNVLDTALLHATVNRLKLEEKWTIQTNEAQLVNVNRAAIPVHNKDNVVIGQVWLTIPTESVDGYLYVTFDILGQFLNNLKTQPVTLPSPSAVSQRDKVDDDILNRLRAMPNIIIDCVNANVTSEQKMQVPFWASTVSVLCTVTFDRSIKSLYDTSTAQDVIATFLNPFLNYANAKALIRIVNLWDQKETYLHLSKSSRTAASMDLIIPAGYDANDVSPLFTPLRLHVHQAHVTLSRDTLFEIMKNPNQMNAIIPDKYAYDSHSHTHLETPETEDMVWLSSFQRQTPLIIDWGTIKIQDDLATLTVKQVDPVQNWTVVVFEGRFNPPTSWQSNKSVVALQDVFLDLIQRARVEARVEARDETRVEARDEARDEDRDETRVINLYKLGD